MKASRLLLASAVLICAGSTTAAQVNIQPTPAPLVTAENEAWYRMSEPLAFAGSLYYPAGAAIHFLPDEMVRSGFYRGVPLYSRTTIEPYSTIFVPVGGGLMQPYERRRDFDLAGTQASTAPAMAQAAAPPVIGAPVVVDEPLAPPAAVPVPAQTASHPVGTTGRAAETVPRRPFRIRPGSANGIYFEFDNARWFSAGLPVSIDVRSLTQVGESHGFPVYAARPGDTTIYVPIARGMDALAMYSRRK
jgi:hypothetical protein